MEKEVCDAFGWWKIDLSSESTCKCYTTGLCQSAAFREDNMIDWLWFMYIWYMYIFLPLKTICSVLKTQYSWCTISWESDKLVLSWIWYLASICFILGLHGWCSCQGNQPDSHHCQNPRPSSADNQNCSQLPSPTPQPRR